MGKAIRPVVAVVVLLLVSLSYWGYHQYCDRETADIRATGTIEATTVELNAKLPGVIQMLSVGEGDAVCKGQWVAALARNDLVAQRERDALAVLRAEAQLEDLTSGARSQKIEEALANVNIAQANFDKATADFKRRQILFEQGALSEEELDSYHTNVELGKNRLQVAQSRLSLLKAGNRSQLITTARLEVQRSKAILKATEAMLEDMKIYSPIAGVVLTRNYEPGEYVLAGVSLATVADLKNLWIKVYIPTDDLPAIKLGQRVQFTVSGGPHVFEGVVSQIASRGEFTPKTIQTKPERANVVFGVKIRICDGAGILKPGMPADVTFKWSSKDD